MKQAFQRLLKFDSFGEKQRFLKFKADIQDGLQFVCVSCYRIFFKNQVVPGGGENELKSKLTTMKQLDLIPHISKDCTRNGRVYLCITCNKYIFKKNKLPPLSFLNGLQLDSIPACLQVNELESSLIARNIIFLKLFQLPVSRWSAVKDKVVNVPITENDLEKTMSAINVLPRQNDEAGLLPVQLKRKVSYKNIVSEAFVNPKKLINALTYLKQQNHPGYKNISINSDYTYTLDIAIPEEETSCLSDSTDDETGGVTNQHQKPDRSSMMIDDHSDMRLVTNTTNNIIQHKQRSDSVSSCSIAPGEGKIPINLLRSPNWDVNAFPHLHASGKYGLDFERKISLTPQQYFNQRLLNMDKRFSSCTPYVFASLYYVERYQLEQQINISCQKGQMHDRNLLSIEDGFSVFDKIPGTPRYWLQKRNEMIARLEQLGPFQFFFTLSMADKRWEENFVSILAQRGCNITFQPTNKDSVQIEADFVFVNGIPLHDFLANENLGNLMRENILTLTRNFDHRVKAFMRNIVHGRNSPFNVKYYTYRIEFQARGAAHVHGVLWLDMDKICERDPLLRRSLAKLELCEKLSYIEKASVSNFVDSFITTTTNSDIKSIVSDVQTHHHTRTCTKRGGSKCRFGYPRFPSEETIIAQPLKKEDFPSEALYQERKKYYETILDEVEFQLQRLLECAEDLDDISLKQILFEAGVSRAEYYEALSVSSKGTKVILKRTVRDMFVNNYNTEWLRAWNGNMDLQVCLDTFAIITYITDYYSKDESGTTSFLREAAKQNFSSVKEKMKCLSQVFMTHRQMGQCEAFYRILPSLHLSQSNVKCKFVHSGFPSNRSKFLRKVNYESKRLVECDDSDDECANPLLVKIPNREGSYEIMPSVHDQYANRPSYLEKMCFAQFVISYDKVPASQVKKLKFKNGISDIDDIQKIVQLDKKTDIFLPLAIQLQKKQLGCLKLRSFPAVLRFHKFKETQDCHEYYYSELLFFKHWRNEETELGRNNFQKCFKLFHAHSQSELSKPEENRKTFLQEIKECLFPFRNNVLQTRLLLENISSNEIGDQIDPESQLENEEARDMGTSPDTRFSCRNPDLLDEVPTTNNTSDSKYKRLDISNIDFMLTSARKLAPEQRCAFDIMIRYCKDLRKSMQSNCPRPKPPLFLVHGGAGSGKSKLINDIALWAEYFLRTGDNRHPDQPLVMKVAPTGKAASIIQGLTLHSAFHFNFGNEYRSLSDQLKENMRNDLSQLRILIVDEISMVKADLLYQLNSRLQEIKQSFDDFGGVSVLLFGDLMQLKPIQANWIFEAPKDQKFKLQHDISPLWNLFSTIELTENHRQGEDKEYANMLNRIRFGDQTPSDIEKLRFRQRNDFPSDTVYVFPTRRPVHEVNIKKLNDLQNETVVLKAINVHQTQSNYRPVISSDGFVNNTPFLSDLMLKVGAKVMLTYNCDTSDGLTNGSPGTVMHFAKNGDSITHILVLFDEKETGHKARQKNQNFALQYPECTPIGRVSFEYSLGLKKEHTAKAKVIQFPFMLAWALTAHKMQGQTIKKPNCLVADLKGVFTSGQTYVILGRVQDIRQLYLLSFTEKCIKVNEKAKNEAISIKERSINHQYNWDQMSHGALKIISLNIRSLRKHFFDVLSDSILMKADILSFNETHLTEHDNSSAFEIPNYVGYYANKGKGAGVAIYVSAKINILCSKKLVTDDFQIIKISTNQFDFFGVYKAPHKKDHNLLNALSCEANLKKNVFICGDFNMHYQPNLTFAKTLSSKGFRQVVCEPTHMQGNLLDHFYVKTGNIVVKSCFLHSPYYSDHDATCVICDRIQN